MKPVSAKQAFAILEDVAKVLRLTQKFATVTDTQQLYPDLVNMLHQDFERFHHAWLYLSYPSSQQLVLMASSGDEPGRHREVTPEDQTQKLQAGVLGQVAQSGKTYVARDISKDPNFAKSLALPIRSVIAVAIRSNGDTVGVLQLGSREPNAFGPEVVQALEILSSYIGQLIQASILNEELKNSASQLEGLTGRLRRSDSRMDLLCKQFGCVAAVLDTEGRLCEIHGAWEKAFPEPRSKALGQPFENWVHVRSHKRLGDYLEATRRKPSAAAAELGVGGPGKKKSKGSWKILPLEDRPQKAQEWVAWISV